MARPIRGDDPFNQNSDRSDREKRSTSKGGPVFSKLFRLDRTDPLSFGPKFREILVEWIASRSTTQIWVVTRHQYGISAFVSQKSFGGETSGSVANCLLFSHAKENTKLSQFQTELFFVSLAKRPLL